MTDTTRIDAVVDDYLRRVGAALTDVPRERSREIVEELGEHIREAREDGAVVTEVDARNLVDRLGSPAVIADDARRRFGQPTRSTAGGREIAALLLLTVGVLVPVFGWAAAVLLIWTSGVWNRRDKVIGTVLAPAGLLVVGIAAALANVAGAPGGVGHFPILMIYLLPVVTAVYLLVRLNRRPALS